MTGIATRRSGDWIVAEEAGRLVLARRWPAAFDVAAETRLPKAPGLRLAHQVRKDLWRALRDVRGFSPVVEIREEGDRLHLTAGGQVSGRAAPGLSARISEVLEDGATRERWIAHSRRGR
ncbi:hypothetical protein [Pelagovum pacificum]|uniref:Uncharacterized protein n=1 Tax=Pelagovum pacificum TaxID=2588711 RepID=A0A5C5GD07_9RHOB|nr:hypothetical protein [Pelagovum pacificum]QQA41325.1 hypothetical protein I8N54_10830 [Pelagovum pacificum]TNY31869.1 hypothetical protein FHY64_00765 [Pelagovum pacificum]